MENRFPVVKLTRTQKNVLCVSHKYYKLYQKEIAPHLDPWFEEIQARPSPAPDDRKVLLLVYQNKKLEVHYKAVEFLAVHGFGSQANALCRTMFEVWFDSEYIRFSEDDSLFQKSSSWSMIGNFRRIQKREKWDREWVGSIKTKLSEILKTKGRKLAQLEGEIDGIEREFYGGNAPDHWTGTTEKERWDSISGKSIKVKEKLLRGERYFYPMGSAMVYGTDFSAPVQFPSPEESISRALVGSLFCFLGQSDGLAEFLSIKLDAKWKQNDLEMEKILKGENPDQCPL